MEHGHRQNQLQPAAVHAAQPPASSSAWKQKGSAFQPGELSSLEEALEGGREHESCDEQDDLVETARGERPPAYRFLGRFQDAKAMGASADTSGMLLGRRLQDDGESTGISGEHLQSTSPFGVSPHISNQSSHSLAARVPPHDNQCDTLKQIAMGSPPRADDSKADKYDIFLSHLQRNAQDTIISLQMFLKEVRPTLKFFIDVDVEMTDGLHETLRKGVLHCKAFLFFITDGILESIWCAQELRWAVEYEKNIILVRETDTRHGGIEMKDFFAQVPEDLLPVFKNNIAIPWYREKGFRGVSVHTILKRAALEDEAASELQKLQDTKRQLMAVVKRRSSVSTAFSVIEQHSAALRAVIFVGGFHSFKRPCLQRIYDIIFNVSFWACGAACAVNLGYRMKPYHNFPTDMLTAYVHLPAWQSWYVWRKFVKTHACEDLLSRALSNRERQDKMNLVLRVGGWLVLLIQCAMVCDVLAGFSLPRTLELSRGNPEPHEFYNFDSVHSLFMWLVIPPVISAMFASYVMFAFVAMLHLMDIAMTKDLLSQCITPLAGYYGKAQVQAQPAEGGDAVGKIASDSKKRMTPRSESGSGGGESASEFGGSQINEAVGNIQEFQRAAVMEESLFRTVAELLVFLIDDAQTRIEHTSSAVGGLWLHLVLFSVAQVLAIASGLEALGTGHVSERYEWWWGLQDFFHLGGGIVLLFVAMGVFCIVTSALSHVPREVFKLLAGVGVPVSRQASVVSLLGTRPLGMRVAFGFILVDMPKACGFFFILAVLLAHKCMFVLSILTELDQEK